MASPTNRKGGVAQKVGVILQPGKESLPFRAGSDVEKSCQAEPKSVSLYQRFYEVVRRIPPGRVATYGQVARAAGYPGYARQVGYALFRLQGQNTDIPWHRVINAQGCISYSPFRLGYDDLQKALLQAEGIHFDAQGRVDLQQFGWDPWEA